jgi:Spy/CpxP family protein refolding chaperone
MKKYLAAAALVGVIGFAGMSIADARGYGYGPGGGSGNCDGGRYCNSYSYDEKDKAKAETFFEETKELRKEIVVKRSTLDAIMLQDNPDEKKVAKLTGDLYDLQSQMDDKAGKAFEGKAGYGPGPGFGNCGKGRRSW